MCKHALAAFCRRWHVPVPANGCAPTTIHPPAARHTHSQLACKPPPPNPGQVVYERLSRQQVLELLCQHLTANLVRLRRRWCAQARGIAQGSTLSTLLCR